MARSDQGLKSEALRLALQDALRGLPERLEELLARHGAASSLRPNLTLAAAFGTEIAGLEGRVDQLLLRLGAEDAAPDDARAFLPVAAAHGWAGRLREGKDEAAAWHALHELAADERAPVRLGTLDALANLAIRPGFADRLLEAAMGWLDHDGDRELLFGSAALVLEAFGDPKLLTNITSHDALLDYLTRTLRAIEDAPRSAERSEGRRRVLMSIPRALTNVAVGLRAGDRGMLWLTAECERAEHPDLRRALSQTTEQVRTSGRTQGDVAERLKQTLEASAKPLRDPSRVRPGTGRGKHSRGTR